MKAIAVLDHISLTMPAHGEEAARAFFSALLGLSEIPKPNDGNRMDGCWFDLGAQQLHMLVDENFTPAKRSHPAFLVEDLNTLRQSFESAGIAITDFKPSEGRSRFFSEDPFGNRLEFISPRKNI